MKKTLKYFAVAIAILVSSPKLFAQISIGVSVHINPPALPVYSQPACPADGYLWVPGYWAWSDTNNDYYWVPGVWVSPPQPGYLWTPGYWGYDGNVYVFHQGYWGRHIGFYGGVNYGYGYGGSGFHGGRWEGSTFRYNTAVVNVNNTVVHNTYIDRTVIVNNTTVNNHNSFNGPGGVTAKPRPEEVKAMNEPHVQATSEQQSHEKVARSNPSQFAKANNGKPATTAMNKVNGHKFNSAGHNAKASPAIDANNKTADKSTTKKPTDDNANINADNSKTTKQERPDKKHSEQPGEDLNAAKPADHAKTNKQSAHNGTPAAHKPSGHHKAKPGEKPEEKHRG
ncbi:YXWGXW repeat-containing protein [Mucilaginibacter sp.]|uniref:YXWGXW repeat-containing protein n=1 Tax=Mucilaginibacter sp. TaxID=1882438 RepID=UPI00260FFB85|nr:YXWGXW repeat-containing protein [Mucilaginibacter sp.]MDB4918440.1 repeat-containing protein [Mucilaginibacter sp.]